MYSESIAIVCQNGVQCGEALAKDSEKEGSYSETRSAPALADQGVKELKFSVPF